eukprot:m.357363 g.357363  ORF g.357363 m.357363 type:complete len:112 (-) comp55969_c0_seq20:874-1209(-)
MNFELRLVVHEVRVIVRGMNLLSSKHIREPSLDANVFHTLLPSHCPVPSEAPQARDNHDDVQLLITRIHATLRENLVDLHLLLRGHDFALMTSSLTSMAFTNVKMLRLSSE